MKLFVLYIERQRNIREWSEAHYGDDGGTLEEARAAYRAHGFCTAVVKR